MADSNITKSALASALKELMETTPFAKITVSDICAKCNMNRKSFYYHFKDIYDLVEWSCLEDAKRALDEKKTYETWQQGLLQIFEAVQDNKPFILNVYRSVSREQIENYLYQLTYGLLEEVVKEQVRDRSITEAEMNFIAEFYKYGFVGMMLDWIKKGMSEEPNAIVDKMSTTLSGNIANSIQNFAAKRHE